MTCEFRQPAGLRLLPLRAGAGLAAFVGRHAEARSRPEKVAAGFLTTAAAVVLAQRLGADVRAGFGGTQPDLAMHVIRGVLSRPSGG